MPEKTQEQTSRGGIVINLERFNKEFSFKVSKPPFQILHIEGMDHDYPINIRLRFKDRLSEIYHLHEILAGVYKIKVEEVEYYFYVNTGGILDYIGTSTTINVRQKIQQLEQIANLVKLEL